MSGPDHKGALDAVIGDVAHALRHAAQAAEEGRFAVASMFAATAGQLAAQAGASSRVGYATDDSPERLLPSACERLASAFRAVAARRELARLDKEIG